MKLTNILKDFTNIFFRTENVCTFVETLKVMDEISALEELQKRRNDIKVKLSTFYAPENISPTSTYWVIGNKLGVSGQSVKNYIKGKISDGYLADAIYKELKRLKLTK